MAGQTVETIPISVAASIAPQRAVAVRAALLNRALPLARMVYGRAEPLATASLVADGATLALLTAAHVFEHVATGDLVVPLPREGAWACLRSARARVIADPDRDIALIMIGDAAVARRLRANWTPVEPSQLHIELRDDRAGQQCQRRNPWRHHRPRSPCGPIHVVRPLAMNLGGNVRNGRAAAIGQLAHCAASR